MTKQLVSKACATMRRTSTSPGYRQLDHGADRWDPRAAGWGRFRLCSPLRVTIASVSPTRDQQLARLRAQRRAQRAQRRSRQRKIVAVILAGVLVLAAAGVVIGVVVSSGSSKNDTASLGAKPQTTASASAAPKVACNGPAQQLAKAKRTFTSEPKITIDPKASYTMVLDTSCGAITIPLETAKAPHTVNLLSFLAADHFYDGTFCHRSVASASLTVLQCGDPTGTGSGQLGFTIGEENLKGAIYPRGTLAMAKTVAPHSTGSQFFLVDKASDLPPQYTVAGHITKSGLEVLDKLMAVGNDGSNGAGDGAPKEKIYLEKVTVTKS